MTPSCNVPVPLPLVFNLGVSLLIESDRMMLDASEIINAVEVLFKGNLSGSVCKILSVTIRNLLIESWLLGQRLRCLFSQREALSKLHTVIVPGAACLLSSHPYNILQHYLLCVFFSSSSYQIMCLFLCEIDNSLPINNKSSLMLLTSQYSQSLCVCLLVKLIQYNFISTREHLGYVEIMFSIK